VSAFVGLVAASLPPGSEVLTVEGDFTSVLFPFLARAEAGTTVREVALEALADEVRPSTSLVASPPCSRPTDASPTSTPCTPRAR
jgi:selenocysteine lyase/cysteine desulfurase